MPREIPAGITSPKELGELLGVSRQYAHHLLHPQKYRARLLLHYAVRRGDVIKPSCCSRCQSHSLKLEAHHADYDKPLEVEWLCVPCHKAEHPLDRSKVAEMGRIGGAVVAARLKLLPKDELRRRMTRIARGQSPEAE